MAWCLIKQRGNFAFISSHLFLSYAWSWKYLISFLLHKSACGSKVTRNNNSLLLRIRDVPGSQNWYPVWEPRFSKQMLGRLFKICPLYILLHFICHLQSFHAIYRFQKQTIHTVACRAVTRQRPRDKQIYQSRYWVTPSQTKDIPTETIWATIEELCFLCGPSRNVITETRLEVKSVGRDPPFREDLSTEVEESQLLEAVTRKRPVETVTDWEH
jgi:hypothetical protein